MDNTSNSTILDYQQTWQEKFQVEKQILQEVFGSKALEIEHIGSTSIEGLAAKPIVDIAVMIENHQDANLFTEPLAKVGYQVMPASTERNYYTKGNPAVFHLSVAFADHGGFWPRQILFRDYLRKHPEVRDEYEQLKKRLLHDDPTGGQLYIDGKTEFVYRVLKLAGWKEGQTYSDLQQ
jgi:GrpB-like predicted nucleotidyltransferase (UPF0157 family)